MAQAEYDGLAAELSYEEYHTQRGAYHAARRIVDLVDNLIAKAEEHHDRTRESGQHARDHRRSIFYGSHLWRGE